MTINLKIPDLTELKPRLTVIGVGGAGGNAVNNMIASGLQGVEFVVANTDAQALTSSSAQRRIQMGTQVTEGLGAGSKPDIGAAAAEEAMADIKAHLAGAHMVFITAGMGGGTGTGAAPVIARASRDEGILTVAVVTKPFQFEGQRRMHAADAGIAELQKYVDTLLIIPNQNLFRVANERTTFADAFAMADDVLRAGVSCITDLMVKEGLINLDFADVRTIMAGMGKAMMGTGESSGDKRAVEAAEAAISNPLLDDVSMKGASGLLVSITGGSDLTLYEVDEAASRIRQEADAEANIIVGATFDEDFDGSIRVSVVATGLGPSPAEAARPAEADAASKARLSERLATLSVVPNPAERRPATLPGPAAPAAGEPPVWRAPGNVTIEKRPHPLTPMGPSRAPVQAEAKPKPQVQFVPGAPAAAARRVVRRMPNVEELPVVAQNALRGKDGEAPGLGLEAQKRKVGFLERLAGVGRGRKEEMPEQDRAEPAFGDPETAAPARLEPSLNRRRSDTTVKPLAVSNRNDLPKLDPLESEGEEDLDIPAFLRRQAT
jgi:cell division protein FtsZ